MDYKERAFEVAAKSCARCGQEPGMVSAIEAALRSAAADAYEDAAFTECQYDQVHADWCASKAASLRAGEGR